MASSWGPGLTREREIYSSAAFSSLAKFIFKPSGAAITRLEAPFCLRSWARQSPVGPAPNMRTDDPSLGAILSIPWQAHDAGSRRVASTSLRLWILKTLPAG